MNLFKKNLVLMACMGAFYLVIEVAWGAITSGSIALKGQTSLWMIIVGGLTGWILGLFDELKIVREKINNFWRGILGMILIYAVEYGAGVLLNGVFKFDIWRYTDFANINGQITLLFIPIWFSICPIAFWFDNFLRYHFYEEGDITPNIRDYYKDFYNPIARQV